jgi:import inner membrane translocase subunit TIM50
MHHQKQDLSYLNRDLTNVIMIDWDTKKLQNQPDNLIALPEFKAEAGDRELYNLLPFLEC